MDATIIAAIIAAGSTSIVAVVGFLTTRAVSRQAIEASTDNTIRALDAAREEQVWQQRAAAYVDAIMAVQWQQGRRHRELSILSQGVPLIPESSRETEKPPVDWAELSPRLFAFASLAVLRAFQAASDAGIEARKRYRKWEDSGREARAEQTNLEPQAMEYIHAAMEAATQAVQAANDRDDALIEAIRVDLHGEAGRALQLLLAKA